MKLIQQIFDKDLLVRIWQRDALVLISALFSFVLGAFLIFEWKESEELLRVFTVSLLGVSLFLAVRRAFFGKNFWIASGASILAIAFYSAWGIGETKESFWLHFTGMALLTHLFIAVAPWVKNQNISISSFWNYNWYLLTRFVYSGICSVIFMVGIDLALFAVTSLFEMKIAGEWYSFSALFSLVLLNTLILLIALDNYEKNAEPEGTPKELRLLVSSIFTPLTIVYFLISYAYLCKIFVGREWPKGGVGWTVSGLTFLVFLSYLIQKPLEKNSDGLLWLKKFWKTAFIALIAPLFTLLLALYVRIAEYGWTETRYIAMVLGLWALGIAVYNYRPERRGIVFIPLTLLILGAVTWRGPLSPNSFTLFTMKWAFHNQMSQIVGKESQQKFVYTKKPTYMQLRKIHADIDNLWKRLPREEFIETFRIPVGIAKKLDIKNCVYKKTTIACDSDLRIATKKYYGVLKLQDELYKTSQEDDTTLQKEFLYRNFNNRSIELPRASTKAWYLNFENSGNFELKMGDYDVLKHSGIPRQFIWLHNKETQTVDWTNLFSPNDPTSVEIVAKDGKRLRIYPLSMSIGMRQSNKDISINGPVALFAEIL
jgi:hypothetical protein